MAKKEQPIYETMFKVAELLEFMSDKFRKDSFELIMSAKILKQYDIKNSDELLRRLENTRGDFNDV